MAIETFRREDFFKKDQFVKKFSVEYYFINNNFKETRKWLRKINIEDINDLYFKVFYKSMLKYELSLKNKLDKKRLKRTLEKLVIEGNKTSFKARGILQSEFGEFYPLRLLTSA